MLFTKSFIVLCLTFKSMIHFESRCLPQRLYQTFILSLLSQNRKSIQTRYSSVFSLQHLSLRIHFYITINNNTDNTNYYISICISITNYVLYNIILYQNYDYICGMKIYYYKIWHIVKYLSILTYLVSRLSTGRRVSIFKKKICTLN